MDMTDCCELAEGAGPHQVDSRPGLGANFASIVASIVVGRSAALLYHIIIRRLLSPVAIGSFNIIETAVFWLAALTIGVSYSSERLIPLYRGQGRMDLDTEVRASLFKWTFLEGVLVAAGAAVYALLFGGRHSSVVRVGLYWLPVLFLIQKMLNAYLVLFRSTKEFQSYSVARVLFSLLDWATIPFVVWLGLPGLFASMAGVAMLKLVIFQVLLQRHRLDTFDLRLGGEHLKRHLPYGPKYAVYKLVFSITQRIDAMLVGFLVGTQALAFYFLSNQIAAVVVEVPLVLAYISFPNLMERFKVGGKNITFTRELDRYMRLQLYVVLPVVMPVAYFGSEFIVRNVLPAYEPGLWAVKLAIMALGFSAARHFYYQVFYAHERLTMLTLLSGSQLGLLFGAYFLVEPVIADPVVAVAMAAFLAQVGHFALLVVLARRLAESNMARSTRRWGADFLACSLLAGLLLGADMVVPLEYTGALVADFVKGALMVLVFVAVMVPLSYVGLGRHRAGLVAFAAGSLRALRAPVGWTGLCI